MKGTAATEGEENPDWEETIEFAVPGDVVEQQNAEVSLLQAPSRQWKDAKLMMNLIKRLLSTALDLDDKAFVNCFGT